MAKQQEGVIQVKTENQHRDGWLEQRVSAAMNYLEKRPLERRGVYSKSNKKSELEYG